MLCSHFIVAQEIKYVSGQNSWNPDSLGNHRAVVQVTADGPVSRAAIEWRRSDDAAAKAIYVVDAQTSKRIMNVKTENVSRERADIYFEPVSGKGKYFIYYMPYKVTARSNYPNAVYYKPENTASADWLQKTGNYTRADLLYLESVNEMNSPFPMKVTATAAEVGQLVKTNPGKAYLVFTEDRKFPVKLRHDLPRRWIQQGVTGSFSGTASKGENYSFQLGVYPVAADLKNVTISFAGLKDAAGHAIPAAAMSCLNTNGTKYNGSPFTQVVDVKKGDVQALWCLVNIPVSTAAGIYTGTVTVKAAGLPATPVKVSLRVTDDVAVNGGTDQPELQTRLAWLNSTLAQHDDVIKPYTPITVNDKTIGLLGRKIILSGSGFPEQIQTFFTPEMTGMTSTPRNLFTDKVRFSVISTATHEEIPFKNTALRFTQKQPGIVKWETSSRSETLTMDVSASAEFDGYLFYTVKLTALRDVSLEDTRLQFPFEKNVANYLMGLGFKGGKRPVAVDWKWEVATKNQDGAWIGDVNAGLQYTLRDEHYSRPLNTNFYLQKPLVLPSSWGNAGNGGIRVKEDGNTVLSDNYSGPRSMKKGEVLYYNFTLLVTPFHPINTDFQWATRFYHKYNALDTIKKLGATVVNIHHATPINPYINYPFIEHEKMKKYIDSAHGLGLKVKIYNTVRELSNSAYETFPLRSLGHEIYSAGKGGGYSWLQEQLGDDYIAAWYVPGIKDAAVVNSGMSRWHNYYVEGMNWLVQNVGIDGIYLDDVAFDRVTMKRIKRVLTKDGHPGIIDLHSANQYNKSDGFMNSANLYMEHFPYLDRLWFGEYFDYEKNEPDFFLTEVSGIPFGLMGEMLEGGGNPWRGLVYGMTCRMPWKEDADPRYIWKAWDAFGMQGTEMIGYWVENNPVKTDNGKVLATIYKKTGKAMISIASWAAEDTKVKLKIDWKALGIDPSQAKLTADEIRGFQPAAQFDVNGEIPINKGKGWLLILE
ncbi:hypothetical protein EG028_01160 [Chitinophaga barathri]|uniref:Glycoside hydrolase 123-like N-terminal domain-containing protein n=1 Tax=Chitinophaga barathri TaxID=1647451 RepID=A0A3N4MIA2_9BACT|nr:hypothetical protein EG028_01160 [Chitinophaga barathri]